MEHFLTHLQKQITERPDVEVLIDHKDVTRYTYRTMAEQMTRLDILLHRLGIEQGDKIALCGRNSANWGVAFFSLMASRRVAVSILPDFTPEGIRDLINHSESKLFFCGDLVWKRLMEMERTAHKDLSDEQLLQSLSSDMPNLKAVLSLTDFSPLMLAEDQLHEAVDGAEADYLNKFPQGLCPEMIRWNTMVDDEMIMINYTSGTTSSPKGVMISTRSLCSNVEAGFDLVPDALGQKVVSILPMAHMYGLAIEFIFPVVSGACLYYISKTPTPAILVSTFQDVRPFALVCVPLVLEKIFRQKVLPVVKKPLMRVALQIPLVKQLIERKIKSTLMEALGGNLRYFVIGGAALNQEVESWMHRLGLPYLVGYGMTECGPLIAASRCSVFKPYSCGKAIARMMIRIDSEDPQNVPGEIQTKGDNLMLGYFKNEEATRNTFTEDGWLKTGDLGVVDKDYNLFIKGRSKSMILGPSGQNIYPEEIEDKVNSIPGVTESLVVERDGHLVALVFPDALFTKRLGRERHEELINKRLKQINKALPSYSQIKNFEFVEKEFEKTPKRSIKRFLYK